MILRSDSLLFILFICPLWLLGQYSNVVHYTVKDGLPSSTVYSIAQDSKGFIWIGTDAGLVRFDGTNFKTYTTDNGLPDNEVLGLIYDKAADKLWVLTYSKDPCYLKKGKLYSANNDKSLSVIKLKQSEFLNGSVRTGGGIYLFCGNTLYSCVGDSIWVDTIANVRFPAGVHRYADSSIDILSEFGVNKYIKGLPVKSFTMPGIDGKTNFSAKWYYGGFFVCRKGIIDFYYNNDTGYQYRKTIMTGQIGSACSIILNRDKYLVTETPVGVYEIDTCLKGTLKLLWSGAVNSVSLDKESNVWIATRDDGIYILKSSGVVNYSVDKGLSHDNISALAVAGENRVYIGNTYGEIYMLDSNKIINKVNIGYTEKLDVIRAIEFDKDALYITADEILKYNLTQKKLTLIPHFSGGPKTSLKLKNNNDILFGLIEGLLRYEVKDKTPGPKNYFNHRNPVSSLAGYISEDMEYVTLDGSDAVTEQRFFKRIISMAEHPDGQIYCGSLDGIYKYSGNSLTPLSTGNTTIHKRISCLVFTRDSLLWIGTASDGVLVFDGKSVIGQINSRKYLSYHGAICRKVIAGKKGEVWVATNNGVNKVSYHYADSLTVDNVTPITTADGLLSDDVNDILLKDSLLYVATAHGLSTLNIKDMSGPTQIPVYITSLRINDKDSLIHDNKYDLTYKQNDLLIEYIGVSLLSGGYIRYQYRLLNGDYDKWETTTNTSIEFRSLSSGDYTFEVAVLDKFGHRSEQVARVRFHIHQAFYRTIWFWSLVFIIVLAIGFYIIRSVFTRRQRAYEKEQSYTTKIIELEQQALKAQMNPHFIFNCLTAIQHYINKEDIYSANMYLSNFARLIRKTLDLSGEQYITLDKEIAYLENYIQLEKMRFQDKFNYYISVAAEVDTGNAMIPPMLIQPIIENAIRHGLRYKDNNEGILNVDFSREGNSVICKINDNGIGMKRSLELKTNTHVEYQSKGMKLTESRINAINMISEMKISMEVKEKYDIDGVGQGTLVIIYFEQ